VNLGADGLVLGAWVPGDVTLGPVVIDAAVTLEGLALVFAGDGLRVTGARGRLTLADVTLRPATADEELYPIAVTVEDGALATLDRVTITNPGYAGLRVDEATADVRDLAVQGQRWPYMGPSGQEDGGSVMLSRAVLDAERVSISDGDGAGVRAELYSAALLVDVDIADVGQSGVTVWDASVTCRRCTVARATQAGVSVGNASVVLEDLGVSDVAARGGGSAGVLAWSFDSPVDLDLTRATVQGGLYAAVWIDRRGASDVAVRIVDSDLAGGVGAPDGSGVPVHGNAVYATGGVLPWDGQRGLLIEGTTFRDSVVGVLLDASAATFDGDSWTGNGVDLVQQDCVEASVGVEEAPVREICLDATWPTADWPPVYVD
jgi:hypothetical protein